MTTLFLENGSSLSIKNDVIYIDSQESNVNINVSKNPIAKHNRIFLENGDSIGIFDNQFFIDTVQTKVYVNHVLAYRLFPSFISESFREFCSNATHIKKENIGEVEYIIAYFTISDVQFTITTPPHKDGSYRFSFSNALPELSTNIGKNVAMLQKFNFYNFTIEMGDTQNVFVLKNKEFHLNNLLHILPEITKQKEEKHVNKKKDHSA